MEQDGCLALNTEMKINHSLILSRRVKNILLLGSFLLLSFFLFYGNPVSFRYSRSFREAWDLGHIVYFFIISWWLNRQLLQAVLSTILRWLMVLSVALLLGAVTEWLQYGSMRSASLGDLGRDMIGCLLALVLMPGSLPGQRLRRPLQVLVFLLFVWQLRPLLTAVLDEYHARMAFPILADFSAPFELQRWQHGSASRAIIAVPASQRRLLQIGLGTEQYSGAGLSYFPGDWTAYTQLEVRLLNPGTALPLTFRVHDRQHQAPGSDYAYADRFNRSVTIQPGWNQIEFELDEIASSPTGRRMDMTQVADFTLFSVDLPDRRTLYLESVTLK